MATEVALLILTQLRFMYLKLTSQNDIVYYLRLKRYTTFLLIDKFNVYQPLMSNARLHGQTTNA